MVNNVDEIYRILVMRNGDDAGAGGQTARGAEAEEGIARTCLQFSGLLGLL